MENQAITYNGITFLRQKSGYYKASFKRGGKQKNNYIHRYVWETEKGEIPSGYHIHHIDGDKSNNNLSNLECISASAHSKMHMRTRTPEELYRAGMNMFEKGKEASLAWQRSDEGHKWHVEHGKKVFQNLVPNKRNCLFCNKEFDGLLSGKFCSHTCNQKQRRKLGIDNIEITCPKCGKVFMRNKNYKSVTCSIKCGTTGVKKTKRS